MTWRGLVLAGLTCLPVLLLSPFPTQDGPSHIYAGHRWRLLGDRHYATINQAFEHSPSALSTQTVHGAVALLLGILSPLWVEQLIVLACVGGLFAVFIVGADDDRALFFPVCALPLFVMGFALRMGFYSFCLSLPLALGAVGLWTNGGVDSSRRRLILAASLMVALPLFHVVTAGWALALMGACSIGSLVTRRATSVRELEILALLSFPFLAVAVRYPNASGAYVWERIGERVAGLVAGGAFVGAGRYALWWSTVPSVGLLALGVLFLRDEVRRAWHASRAALRRVIVVVVAFLLALLVPEEGAGGAYIGVRANLLFFLLLLFVLRAWRLPRAVDAVLSLVFLALSVVHLSSTYSTLQPASTAEREIIASAARLQEHTTALVVVAGEWVDTAGLSLATQIRPLLHAGDLLGIGADRTILTFYEGELPYFPVNFTQAANPFGVLFDSTLFGWEAPAVRWEGVATWRGGVDYIAVWDEPHLLQSPAEGARFRAVVCRLYEEAYRSDFAPWVIYQLRGGNDTGRSRTSEICRAR